MGDIPEKSFFSLSDARQLLGPYLQLTQAVRSGSLQAFEQAVAEHREGFQADGNLTLVQRLGHNVIKVGLRRINLAYSRISLADIAEIRRGDAA